jgi:hypothetical protein
LQPSELKINWRGAVLCTQKYSISKIPHVLKCVAFIVHLVIYAVVVFENFFFIPGFDTTAGPWPVYLRSGQSNRTKIGPLGQLIFSGHLGQQLSFLPTGRFFVLPFHSISTDNKDFKIEY